jgi:hypothetical protein
MAYAGATTPRGDGVVTPDQRRAWLADVLVGGLVGGVIGAIVAVNVVIFGGIDRGYEATPAQVFRENTVVGILMVTVFVAGPVVGVATARRRRARRQLAGDR